MSFASGFNTGANVAAGLRNSADRRAAMEEDSKRNRVLDEVRTLQAERIKSDMEREKAVYDREQADRLASTVVLGKFSESVRDLDLSTEQGFRDYADLSAKAASSIRDTNARQRFEIIDKNYRSVGMANGFKKMTDLRISHAIEEETLSKELLDKGHPISSTDPGYKEKLQEFRNFKEIEKMIGDDIQMDSIGLELSGPFVPNDAMAGAKAKVREIGNERKVNMSLPAEARHRNAILKRLDNTDLFSQMDSSSGGVDLSDTVKGELQDAITALELTGSAQNALLTLETPTGRLFGETLADLREIATGAPDVATFRAATTQLIPKLARGVFGEVGVLTDTDIENYRKTVASLSNSPTANKILMEATKSLIARGLRRRLGNEAKAGNMVSQYSDQMRAIENIPSHVFYGLDKNPKQAQLGALKQIRQSAKDGLIRPGDKYRAWLGKEFGPVETMTDKKFQMLTQ